MISARKKVRLAYELTVDKKLVRVVYAGKPAVYVHGKYTHDFPKNLQKSLAGLKVGERKTIVLAAGQGYGPRNSSLVMTMPRSRFAQRYHFVGRQIMSETDNKYLAVVVEVGKDTLIIDFNNPLAGKELCYKVLIVGIEGEAAMSREAINKL